MHPTETIDRDSLRDDIPDFRPGDTVKVHVRVVEGNRERVQVFQGAVMRRQGGGVQETFTVRKVSFGVGVERTFPVHSPTIAKIEVATLGDVRRAKLYYLRDRHGKAAKIKERRVARGAGRPRLRWLTSRTTSIEVERRRGRRRGRGGRRPDASRTGRGRRRGLGDGRGVAEADGLPRRPPTSRAGAA